MYEKELFSLLIFCSKPSYKTPFLFKYLYLKYKKPLNFYLASLIQGNYLAASFLQTPKKSYLFSCVFHCVGSENYYQVIPFLTLGNNNKITSKYHLLNKSK